MLLLLQLSSKYLPLAYNVLQGFVRAISLAKEAMKHCESILVHIKLYYWKLYINYPKKTYPFC